jgi:LysR family transcriptional regulator, flagellar master operon regulator
MHLDELRTFLEIIDAGSLVAASRRLHVTPSTVTARLASLEASVGQRLLHRGKSGVELTAAGFTLQRYAELMVQLARQAGDELSRPEGAGSACTIGLAVDLWRGFGEHLLRLTRATVPGVAVAVWPGEHRQLKRWLEIGLVDVAFDYVPHASEGLISQAAFDDELILVSATPEADAQPDGDYVYVDHGDEFRRRHAERFAQAPSPKVTLACADWALEYLLCNGAKGYLPRRHAAAPLAAGALHVVTGAPVFHRQVHRIENPEAVRRWSWYPAVLAAALATLNP